MGIRPVMGIVCGLAAEHDALGPLLEDRRIVVAISGARPAVAEAEARRLADLGCRLLVSWGIAGGLAPGLRTGDLVIADSVVSEAGERWTMTPPAPLPEGATRVTRLIGVEQVAAEVREKQALAAASGAALVDMESHRVARAAAEAGLPALAWRTVSDPAGRALPALAAGAVTASGHPAIGRVLLGLIRRPFDLPDLLAAKRDSDAALAALATSAPALGLMADSAGRG